MCRPLTGSMVIITELQKQLFLKFGDYRLHKSHDRRNPRGHTQADKGRCSFICDPVNRDIRSTPSISGFFRAVRIRAAGAGRTASAATALPVFTVLVDLARRECNKRENNRSHHPCSHQACAPCLNLASGLAASFRFRNSIQTNRAVSANAAAVPIPNEPAANSMPS